LIARLYSPGDSASFFVWWTVVWCASMWLAFGFYNLLPKLAVQARLSGETEHLSGMRAIVRLTGPVLIVGLVPLLMLVLPQATAADVMLAWSASLVGGAAMGVMNLLAALARGYARPGLSGVVQGPLLTAAAVIAVGVRTVDQSWTTLMLATAVALTIAAVIGWVLVRRAVGPGPVHATLLGRRPGPHDPDTLAVGMRTAVSEGNAYLPMWMGNALGIAPLPLAALYAALRLVNAASWAFTSVTAVVTPLLAEAQARRDYGRLQALLSRSAAAGLATTAPAALLGIALAGPLMALVDPSYAAYSDLLVVLILGRLIDATAGPLAECLILGGRARLDLLNQTIGTIALVLTALTLEPVIGVTALAAGATVSFAVANALQLLEIRWLLRGAWAVAGTGSSVASA
jgi:O-antigen/teichoic acid export membrane protein